MRLILLSNIIILFSLLPLLSLAQAQKNTEIVIKEKILASESSITMPEIQNRAVMKYSNEILSGLIPDLQQIKQKKKIEQFIKAQWPKYISQISLIKKTPVGTDNEYEFKINFSDKNLKDLLIEKNFLAESDRFLKIIPFIEWIDEENKVNYQWWRHRITKEKLNLSLKSDQIYKEIKESFYKQGLFFSNPIEQKIFEQLPDSLHIDQYTDENYKLVCQLTGHQLFAVGRIRLSPAESTEKLSAWVEFDIVNPLNLKKIMTFEKKIQDSSNWFQKKDPLFDLQSELKSSAPELASQIFENWQRGTLNSHVYKIEYFGQFSIEDQVELKSKIQTKIPDIKMIKDRAFSLKQISFEIETQLSTQTLSEKILKIPGLKLKIETSAKEDELRFTREIQHD